MIFKKAITPIVTTILMLFVATTLFLILQVWFNSYQSEILVDVEKDNALKSKNTKIESLTNNGLLVRNGYDNNVLVEGAMILDNECDINTNITLGLNYINISNCYLDLINDTYYEVFLFTSNGYLSKNVLFDVDFSN